LGVGIQTQSGRLVIPAHHAEVGSAYASVHERSRACEAGYDWHLEKPLDPQQVVATVLAAKSSPPVR
jgi:hypothetical protein